MQNRKHFIRYHIQAMAALCDRKIIQKGQPVRWIFNFSHIDAKLYLIDRVIKKKVILHAGLEIIVFLEGENGKNVEDLARPVVETILSLISYSTVASCDTAKIQSHIVINDDGTSLGHFVSYPYAGSDIIIGTPRAIDKTIFEAIWNTYNESQYKERILRSLAWFRKGISEKQTVDQFIALWIALEVVKPILRRSLRQRVRREWDGIKDVFQNKIRLIKFDDVAEARNTLFHGYKEISPALIERIGNYIEPTRKAVIYSVGRVLGLSDSITDKIADYTPRRILTDPSLALKGSFQNIPDNIEDLFKRYPEMRSKLKRQRYSIDETGKLSISFSTSHTAHFPAKMIFTADSMEFLGEKYAGIESVEGKLAD